ncbi:MAG: CopY family transcriptional regulator [Candidatus Chloroheliales bacterium]|nr:MAG: CopY family transcriptional regulator [Chloroflexota bacterium]
MADNMKFKFNPTKEGITKVLGPLEAEIMQVVWQMGQATVSDVHRVLQSRRDIAYTTVMTTMSRLQAKNILKRTRVGLSYVYSPAMPKDEFANAIVKSVLDSLSQEFGDSTFRYIVEYVQSSDEKRLAAFEAAVKERRGAKAKA